MAVPVGTAISLGMLHNKALSAFKAEQSSTIVESRQTLIKLFVMFQPRRGAKWIDLGWLSSLSASERPNRFRSWRDIFDHFLGALAARERGACPRRPDSTAPR
ncbi:protein of unknown function [Methylocella tundrae]|uniref:Uncharacterized protein n=1 Tax=Methylocella tundrae TaxID=227605 RepID=A0A4U8Z1E6_METTU|nr:protein of unknown function [Methylocella tundrae]